MHECWRHKMCIAVTTRYYNLHYGCLCVMCYACADTLSDAFVRDLTLLLPSHQKLKPQAAREGEKSKPGNPTSLLAHPVAASRFIGFDLFRYIYSLFFVPGICSAAWRIKRPRVSLCRRCRGHRASVGDPAPDIDARTRTHAGAPASPVKMRLIISHRQT